MACGFRKRNYVGKKMTGGHHKPKNSGLDGLTRKQGERGVIVDYARGPQAWSVKLGTEIIYSRDSLSGFCIISLWHYGKLFAGIKQEKRLGSHTLIQEKRLQETWWNGRGWHKRLSNKLLRIKISAFLSFYY